MPECYYSALGNAAYYDEDTFVTMTYIMMYCFIDPYMLFTADRCFYAPDSFNAEDYY